MKEMVTTLLVKSQGRTWKYWALWCTLSIVLTTNESKKIFPFHICVGEVCKSWPHCKEIYHSIAGSSGHDCGDIKIVIYSLVLLLHIQHTTKTNLQMTARIYCCRNTCTPPGWQEQSHSSSIHRLYIYVVPIVEHINHSAGTVTMNKVPFLPLLDMSSPTDNDWFTIVILINQQCVIKYIFILKCISVAVPSTKHCI